MVCQATAAELARIDHQGPILLYRIMKVVKPLWARARATHPASSLKLLFNKLLGTWRCLFLHLFSNKFLCSPFARRPPPEVGPPERFRALISLLRIAEGLRCNDIVSSIDPSFGNFDANKTGIQSGGSGRKGGGEGVSFNKPLSPRVEEADNLDWLKLNEPDKRPVYTTNSFKGILDLLLKPS